ncbi:TRAP transporter small permease subunit [candidate division KSB3 bacterium]|uniref:TRAP transporter small permease subunit n=1 Tax=candidate division KSB3 bacterium TaxID=2044937 RepID=A0A9D5Q7X2_9BACT|nr:TRAP transporter small permease subunit [candidate division KSB3 bacterium]MBD3326326.1 TRAP transporter small permease subunit [candidate division KSB3 bacterium]
MATTYVKMMNILYWICVSIAAVSIVVMCVIITWGVFTRYVLGTGSFWPEPISIFLAIQFTFYGAAACYRAAVHIKLTMFVERFPDSLKRGQEYFVHVLMAGISLFMIGYGASLVRTTFFQSYPEFQYIRVGVAYSAIPIAGTITLLFVIEKAFFPPLSEAADKEGEH